MSDTSNQEGPTITVDEALSPEHLRSVIFTSLGNGSFDIEVTCVHDGQEHTASKPADILTAYQFGSDLADHGWVGSIDQDNRYVWTHPGATNTGTVAA